MMRRAGSFHDRLDTPTYYQFGAYQLQIELLRIVISRMAKISYRGLKEPGTQASTLNDLANSLQPQRPAGPGGAAGRGRYPIAGTSGRKNDLAIGLGNLAIQQIAIGALAAAEANLRRRIALCREIGNEFQEAVGHLELGRLLAYRGAWAESERELDAALGLFEKEKAVQSQGIVWTYRARAVLLMARDQFRNRCTPQSAIDLRPSRAGVGGRGRPH